MVTDSPNTEASVTLVEPEHYKGIFYIRLSALPIEQKIRIRMSVYRSNIIKILKDDSLMHDCMIYTDYMEWHKLYQSSLVTQYEEAT